MVIERFKSCDPAPIYQRLRESGRHMPDGLKYVDSWIEANFRPVFSAHGTKPCFRPTNGTVRKDFPLMRFPLVSVTPVSSMHVLSAVIRLFPQPEGV
jgi:hypothetical protein